METAPWKARKPRPGPKPKPPPPEAKSKAVSHSFPHSSGQKIQILSTATSPGSAKAVDKDGRTPLHNAARAGSVDNEGADVKAVDKDGRTALHDAARAGSKDTVHQLIYEGADVKAVDKDGRTALHDAARADSVNTILLLIDEGADVKAVDKDGRTALHDAARIGSEDTISRPVAQGADVKAVDKDGRIPLHDALRANLQGLIEELEVQAMETADKKLKAIEQTIRAVCFSDQESALHFDLPRELVYFLQQELSQDCNLGLVPTVTGTPTKAFAATVRDYMNFAWPSAEFDTLDLLTKARKDQGRAGKLISSVSKISHGIYCSGDSINVITDHGRLRKNSTHISTPYTLRLMLVLIRR